MNTGVRHPGNGMEVCRTESTVTTGMNRQAVTGSEGTQPRQDLAQDGPAGIPAADGIQG